MDLLTNLSHTTEGGEGEDRTIPLSELIELTQDCKSTTISAIHTLNDLLLYDKIENKMLQLEREEVGGREFVEGCVRPMEKQVWCIWCMVYFAFPILFSLYFLLFFYLDKI
ncbi:hypothetical protein EON63_03455 [archaeon]|nr:MAG: hypothetical protein EON63_03455 [archaeon]